jgi:hypothetical protein
VCMLNLPSLPGDSDCQYTVHIIWSGTIASGEEFAPK